MHRHRRHPAEAKHSGADSMVERPLTGELTERPGEGAHVLGLEGDLEQLEAGHAGDIIAVDGQAHRLAHLAVELGGAFGDLHRRRGEQRKLSDGHRLFHVFGAELLKGHHPGGVGLGVACDAV